MVFEFVSSVNDIAFKCFLALCVSSMYMINYWTRNKPRGTPVATEKNARMRSIEHN